MAFDIAEIKSRINCVELAQRLGLPIHRSGDRCRSPFHDGKNISSMVVLEEYWYSFSDRIGGDQIDLLAHLQYRGDRGSAITELARMVGLDSSFDDTAYKKDIQSLEREVEEWHKCLRSQDRQYLYARGISENTITRLKIGFHENRIILPYWKNGKPYCWIGRAVGDLSPKYKKRKNTDFTDPAPWGMHTLQYPRDTLYVTEGAFDAVSVDQEGFPVLCTMGANSNSVAQQILSISKRFKKVILAFDNDDAGKVFTRKLADAFLKARIPFWAAIIPGPHKDVSDYYAAGNRIADLEHELGITKVARSITDLKDLEKFARAAVTQYEELDIATMISAADQFSELQKKVLFTKITKPPKESAVADAVAEKYQMIYVDQDGFYRWDETSWVKETEGHVRHLVNLEYGKEATSVRCAGATNLMKSRVIRRVQFNRNPVLTFLNGTFELDTGEFRKPDAEDYCSVRMSYPYEPGAECPTWIQFLKDITNGDEQTMLVLQQIAGYVMFPDCRFQKIFALVGKGGNGKSVYLDILRKLFGEANCTNVEPDKLANEFYPILLKDSLLNLATEINGDFSKAEALLKQISAGEQIMGCYKGMTHIQFYPRCKLVFACNEMPRASVVKGLDRRMVFVDFPCRFVDDPNPLDPLEKKKDINIFSKLVSELPGIFQWAVQGYYDLLFTGQFSVTRQQEKLIQQFQEVSNPVMVFCEEHSFYGQKTKDEIYAQYMGWCETTGNRSLSREVFFPRFRDQLGGRILSEDRVMRNGKRTLMIQFAAEHDLKVIHGGGKVNHSHTVHAEGGM